MQKHSRKAHQSVLEIIGRLLTFLSNNEQRKYGKAATAVKEAAEMAGRMYVQTYRSSPEGRKWRGSRRRKT